MLLNACECLIRALTPSASDVLDANARHAVCTPFQCFESDAAAFGVDAPPSRDTQAVTTTTMALLGALLVAAWWPSRSGGKD